MGKSNFPESPATKWAQFQKDFEDFYFQKDGRERESVMIKLLIKRK
jgi:hypothetical protein